MNVNRYILSICICISILGCVEEIDLQSETALESNSIVVIEATITNELKHQQVKLSKVSRSRFFTRSDRQTAV